jgi:hypothetical protein
VGGERHGGQPMVSLREPPFLRLARSLRHPKP